MVTLHKHGPGHYTARVAVRGFAAAETDLLVTRGYMTAEPGRALADRWIVDTGDNERFFATLAKAREYIDRFYENVPENRDSKRLADRIDGYDRDDLGESPDY